MTSRARDDVITFCVHENCSSNAPPKIHPKPPTILLKPYQWQSLLKTGFRKGLDYQVWASEKLRNIKASDSALASWFWKCKASALDSASDFQKLKASASASASQLSQSFGFASASWLQASYPCLLAIFIQEICHFISCHTSVFQWAEFKETHSDGLELWAVTHKWWVLIETGCFTKCFQHCR